MVQQVTAVFVMIASPSDVGEARDAVHTALSRWNESNAAKRNVVFVPRRWETGAIPMLGDHPQAIINAQLVDSADIVIALFGSRLGSPSPEAISGTVEEIERADAASKPVHLYFSTAPHPNDVEPEQLVALRDFKKELEGRGLLGTYGSPEELTAHVWQALEHDLGVLDLAAAPANPSKGVRFLAQPGEERVPKTDSRGRLRTETKRWVEITNVGTEDALNVRIESLDDGVHVGAPETTVIHAGQTRRIPMLFMLSAGEPIVRIRWTEQSEEKQQDFHVG